MMWWVFLGWIWAGHPESARLVTEDIERFWQAYDAVQAGAEAEASFQSLYFDRGSPGLRAFIESRIETAADLWAVVKRHPRFYRGIRVNSLKVKDLDPELRQYFHMLRELYPAATFPDVYFLIGRMNSGGTTAPAGLLIGTEVFAQDDQTPLDELNDWAKAVFGRFEALPYIVIHELIHFQQASPQSKTLLALSLHEGIADFICEKVAGRHINGRLHELANPREAEIWRRFRVEMHGEGYSNWLYNGGNAGTDWPADLGYYVGYQIAEAYYERTGDKTRAIAEILTITDANAFLEKSGYATRFE